MGIHSINCKTDDRVGITNNSPTNEPKEFKIMNKTAVILALVFGICLVSALNSCKHDPIGKSGCMDINACNYDPDATVDNGSCTFEQFGYDCDGNVMSMRTASEI